MVLYDVIISPKALLQLDKYIDYIQFTLLNEQAAESVWKDAIETSETLKTVAGSLKLCDHPKLEKLGYRSICFLKHKYIMLYRIEDGIVYVEAIYHQLQDYENSFVKEL